MNCFIFCCRKCSAGVRVMCRGPYIDCSPSLGNEILFLPRRIRDARGKWSNFPFNSTVYYLEYKYTSVFHLAHGLPASSYVQDRPQLRPRRRKSETCGGYGAWNSIIIQFWLQLEYQVGQGWLVWQKFTYGTGLFLMFHAGYGKILKIMRNAAKKIFNMLLGAWWE